MAWMRGRNDIEDHITAFKRQIIIKQNIPNRCSNLAFEIKNASNTPKLFQHHILSIFLEDTLRTNLKNIKTSRSHGKRTI